MSSEISPREQAWHRITKQRKDFIQPSSQTHKQLNNLRKNKDFKKNALRKGNLNNKLHKFTQKLKLKMKNSQQPIRSITKAKDSQPS